MLAITTQRIITGGAYVIRSYTNIILTHSLIQSKRCSKLAQSRSISVGNVKSSARGVNIRRSFNHLLSLIPFVWHPMRAKMSIKSPRFSMFIYSTYYTRPRHIHTHTLRNGIFQFARARRRRRIHKLCFVHPSCSPSLHPLWWLCRYSTQKICAKRVSLFVPT